MNMMSKLQPPQSANDDVRPPQAPGPALSLEDLGRLTLLSKEYGQDGRSVLEEFRAFLESKRLDRDVMDQSLDQRFENFMQSWSDEYRRQHLGTGALLLAALKRGGAEASQRQDMQGSALYGPAAALNSLINTPAAMITAAAKGASEGMRAGSDFVQRQVNKWRSHNYSRAEMAAANAIKELEGAAREFCAPIPSEDGGAPDAVAKQRFLRFAPEFKVTREAVEDYVNEALASANTPGGKDFKDIEEKVTAMSRKMGEILVGASQSDAGKFAEMSERLQLMQEQVQRLIERVQAFIAKFLRVAPKNQAPQAA